MSKQLWLGVATLLFAVHAWGSEGLVSWLNMTIST